MRTPTRITAAVVALLALAAVLVAPTSPASSAPAWAPAATATIHPGVQTFTDGAQCTANFIFFDASNNVYIGQAGHCSSLGGNTSTDGCTTPTLPLGTAVDIDGATRPGTLVYNSWNAMQAAGESDPDLCSSNDFALVRIDPADVGRVNPSIPHWGGPTGLNTSGLSLGEDIYSYGNSSLRLGLTVLSPKVGVSNAEYGDGWGHGTTMVTSGIPGDSGSAMIDSQGRATGVLSTLGITLPDGSTNNWADVARALDYARTHGGPAVTLALGTEPFDPNQVPLDL